ncbi:MAG: ABC transporter permease, partial [Holophagales bacterium]|nr:ABC transporter permease [Holophagales bacterium]
MSLFDGLAKDVRVAWRHLLQKPGFAGIAITTLALGIGANVAIFTVAKGVLLDPLPYPESERIVVVMEANPAKGFPRFSVSPPNWVDFRDQNSTFEHMAARRGASFSLTGEGLAAERLSGAAVTGRFFEVYGVMPLHGRWLRPDDDDPNAERVVVLGNGLWNRRFGASSQVLDRLLTLDGETYRVVGVMPEGFMSRQDVFVPLAMDYAEQNRGAHFLGVRGRLAEGASVEQARADLERIAAALEAAYPDSNTGWTTVIEPLRELMVEDFRSIVFLLFGAVALVLLIACVNVANLLLVRLAEREREIALRTALGAGRLRLVRQWLTETVLVAVLGGGLGVLLGFQGTRLLLALQADDIPRAEEIGVDAGVLLFAVGLTLVTGVVLGLLPALQASNPDLAATLKEGGRGHAGGKRGKRIRLGLVLAEVAVAVLLLIGAGLLTQSLRSLMHVDPGFDPEGALTARLELPESKYADEAAQAAFYERLYTRLAGLPGVEKVGAVIPMPLTGSGFVLTFYIEGTEMPAPNEFPFSNIRVVSPRYFEAMGIPLVRGRTFSGADTFDAPTVAVINRSTAEKYWPGQDPLGQRITFGDPEEESDWLTVVGVVADVHHEALSEATEPEIYWSDSQSPMNSTTVVLRTQ